MRKLFILMILGLTVLLVGCGGPLKFNPPDSLIYPNHDNISNLTVGVYISPEMKMKKFEPCEKLIFGSTQCYTGDIGRVLESNVLAAYSKAFTKVVRIDSPDNIGDVDVAVEISYASENLKTTLDGVVAYRTVSLKINQRVFYPAKKINSKFFGGETKCKAWKCKVGGVEKGMDGSEVVLKQLFLPGFAVGGYGKALANIVNTAFCASLRDAVERSAYDLKRNMNRM